MCVCVCATLPSVASLCGVSEVAGQVTGRGVGAGSWIVLISGVGVVALLGFQAATYWTSPASPTSPASDALIGSCWADAQGNSVVPVDCDSSTAKYQVTSTPSSAEYCSSEYIEMDDGGIACIAVR